MILIKKKIQYFIFEPVMIICKTNTDKKKNNNIPALKIEIVFHVQVFYKLFSNQANNLTF